MRGNTPPTAAPEGWRQRVGGFVELPGLLRELGVAPDQVLASAGLDPAALRETENTVPFLAAAQALHHAARQTGRAHLGLLAGERWSLSHLGALGALMRNAPTVGDAIGCLSMHQHLHSDVGAVFLLDHVHTVSLGYTVYRDSVPHAQHAHDLALAAIASLLRELCGTLWAPTEVVIARHAPRDPTAHRQHFRAPVRFDQPYSAVRFAARWCHHPIAGADPERYRALSDTFAPREGGSLPHSLGRALRLLLLQGKSSAEDLAQTLALHRRTLNRRLEAAGTTFRKELDQARFQAARQLLEQTHAPISEVAATLCYGDAAAFLHAFKRWAGMTPARWRKAWAAEPDEGH
jgi:AraC-like DNA-binding protein